MISEDDLREFQEIIDRGHSDFESEVEAEDLKENEVQEVEVEADDTTNVKPDSSTNTTILFITGIFGFILFFAVFIGALAYIYYKYDATDTEKIAPKVAHKYKIPGMESLIMDPIPDGSGKSIKVWCVRTAVPPKPIIAEYYAYFSD